MIHKIKYLSAISLCSLLAACTTDEVSDFIQDPNVQLDAVSTVPATSCHSVQMQFEGNINRYDQNPKLTKASSSSSWADGDKVYITFYNGETMVPGDATYSSLNGWAVNFNGEIGKTDRCEVRYFENPTSADDGIVILNAHTAIYEDANAAYEYEDNFIRVTALLTPKTGRFRFTGASNTQIRVTGVTYYNKYIIDNHSFSTSSELLTITSDKSGKTPYIYGTFHDTNNSIGVIGTDYAYSRNCPADLFEAGNSGYFSIPTTSSHNNWSYGLTLTAAGVKFKMLPVAGYDEGFFLIGETEVTEELFNRVNGKESNSQLPVSVKYNDISSFINKVEAATKLNFDLPSIDQWQYAAKGGKKSNGYTYSGSNTPDDVAWYSGNSNGKKHAVKTKAPNELGIYDMSGNVCELVSNSFYSMGNHHKGCGGSYGSESNNIRNVTVFDGPYDSDLDQYYGFRLILTLD